MPLLIFAATIRCHYCAFSRFRYYAAAAAASFITPILRYCHYRYVAYTRHAFWRCYFCFRYAMLLLLPICCRYAFAIRRRYGTLPIHCRHAPLTPLFRRYDAAAVIDDYTLCYATSH